METFGTRLRNLRLEKGERQDEVAALLKVSTASYSAYESGREPNYQRLGVLAEHYGVTTDYLTGVSDYRNPQNQLVATELGLSESSVHVLKTWKDERISSSLESSDTVANEDCFMWSDIFNQFITVEDFPSLINDIGKRLLPSSRNVVSQSITRDLLPVSFRYSDALDLLLQETLKTIVLKMERERLKQV